MLESAIACTVCLGGLFRLGGYFHIIFIQSLRNPTKCLKVPDLSWRAFSPNIFQLDGLNFKQPLKLVIDHLIIDHEGEKSDLFP